MSTTKKNHEEKETPEEAFAGKKSDGKTVSDGPLKEGTANKESEDDGDKHADAGKGNQEKAPKDLPGQDEAEDTGAGNGDEKEEEAYKGKTYGDAFKEKDGNPRRHSWPEGQKVEYLETVAYLSYPPDGSRKDLYIPTEEDIQATDWE